MSLNKADLSLPEDFQNIVRLFPLPNLVLFPGVIQALHIFEPRYRAMIADALASDELITMALIKPGLQSELSETPEICDVVCVGKIVTHAELEDGRFNLLLLGAKRAKVVRELDDRDTPYRMAEVELCCDHLDCSEDESTALRVAIMAEFRQLMNRHPELDEESLEQLLNENLPLGQLIDLIGYSCNAKPMDQQQLLGALDIRRRAQIALSMLKQQNSSVGQLVESSSHRFPPDFSLN